MKSFTFPSLPVTISVHFIADTPCLPATAVISQQRQTLHAGKKMSLLLDGVPAQQNSALKMQLRYE